MTRCQSNDLLSVAGKECISVHKKCAGTLLNKLFKRSLNFAFSRSRQREDLKTYFAPLLLRISHLLGRIVRIEEYRDKANRGHQFMQQIKALATEFA